MLHLLHFHLFVFFSFFAFFLSTCCEFIVFQNDLPFDFVAARQGGGASFGVNLDEMATSFRTQGAISEPITACSHIPTNHLIGKTALVLRGDCLFAEKVEWAFFLVLFIMHASKSMFHAFMCAYAMFVCMLVCMYVCMYVRIYLSKYVLCRLGWCRLQAQLL